MQRLIDAGQSAYWRRGKPMRRQQLDRLTEVRRRLASSRSHDTLDEAMRELARMTLDAICTSPRTPPRTPQPSAPGPRRADDVALYVVGRRGR